MIADLNPYPDYKVSELSWLRQVPGHWSVRRIKTVLRETDHRSSDGSGTLLSLTRVRGLIPHKDMTDKMHSAKTLVGYKRYSAGQLVMNRMQAWSGMFGAGDIDGLVSPDYAVFDVFGGHSIKLVLELLKTPDLVAQFALESKGIGSGFNRLYTDRFGSIRISLPPPDEQAAIVRFLDWANGRLGRAIRAKRKVIALLNEQKQAIIHRAVTRGLDPSVPLKPSGIPWLGDIPQHWEVLRLGGLVDMLTGFPFPSEGFNKSGNGVRLLRGVNVTPSGLRWKDTVYWVRQSEDRLDEFSLKQGDIILGMDRPVIASGIRASIVQEEDTPALLLQRVARLRPTKRLDARLLLFLLRGRMFGDYMAPIFTGVSVPHLSPGQIRKFKVALPPLDEQRTIIRSIANQTAPLESSIARLEREIELLREYRTRLVADVVTGKLDVRAVAAQLHEEPTPDTPEEDADLIIDSEAADEELAV